MRKKITIVGAGNVGATVTQRLFERGYADLVLVDVVEGLPQGKALDMLESGPVIGTDSQVVGTNSYEETAGSDLAIITAGIARKPGMSRDDLLFTNMDIVGGVAQQIAKHSPECIIIVVSNPLDAMAQQALNVTGFPRERVIGMAGILDTARFRTFLAQEVKASVEDVQAYVLGGHGDTMVPLVQSTNVAGIPIAQLLTEDVLNPIVQRTRDGGAEIVGLLKTGSAFYAPSAAVAQMVDSIILDKKRILPCAAQLNGEYGIDGLYIGVPVKLGSTGIEEIIQVDLSDAEKANLDKSAAAVQELLDAMNNRSS